MKTKSTAVWILMCGAALGVGVVAAYVRQTPPIPHIAPAGDQEPVTEAPRQPNREPAGLPKSDTTILVYLPTMDSNGITFEKRETPVPSGDDPKLFAVNDFLRASQIAPQDAKALSVEVDHSGSATITFNEAFDRTYGAFEEKMMLDGLAAAMGQFSDVNEMTFVIGSKPITTLGSADLTSPIQVIRADAVPLKSVQTGIETSSPTKP